MPNFRYTVGDNDTCQTGAAVKHAVSDFGYAVGNDQLGDIAAATESIPLNGLKGGRKGDGIKVLVPVESTGTNGADRAAIDIAGDGQRGGRAGVFGDGYLTVDQ